MRFLPLYLDKYVRSLRPYHMNNKPGRTFPAQKVSLPQHAGRDVER
jgi:hypothetical protein